MKNSLIMVWRSSKTILGKMGSKAPKPITVIYPTYLWTALLPIRRLCCSKLVLSIHPLESPRPHPTTVIFTSQDCLQCVISANIQCKNTQHATPEIPN